MSPRCLYGVSLLVIMVVICFVIWDLVVVISGPKVPKFRVDSLSVSNFSYSDSSSTATGKWNGRFSIYNPNKKYSISYNVVQSTLLYNPKSDSFFDSELISEIRIPDFNQSARNETFIDVAFAVRDAYRSSSFRDIDVNSKISFNVRFTANFKFKAGRDGRAKVWGSDTLKVHCENLVVSLALSNTIAFMSGKLMQPKNCKVF
ncbi:uncharacterized protein LOC112026161 [Quercus suber]|uniref:uncharacterized protein LOC112026161 n=1 Tax=Quercus suber TaxID=58331 RepID=UPI000D2E4DA7|nr:hypothetical protein CFP56_27494 [Quercus suber]